MAQFFMKMAQAVKANTLQPGTSIPGCNSYFLCKYLKDTMLQAKTYLFAAIRPEVKFQPYTFATLTFAKNASVVKLKPKKGLMGGNKREIELMGQVSHLNEVVESLKREIEALKAAGGGGGGGGGEGEEGGGATPPAPPSSSDETWAGHRGSYEERGILLKQFSADSGKVTPTPTQTQTPTPTPTPIPIPTPTQTSKKN